MHQVAVFFDQVIRQQRDAKAALASAQDAENVVDQDERAARAFAVTGDIDQPVSVLQVARHGRAGEQHDAVIVEFLECARRAEALEVFRRGIGVEVHGE